MKLSIIIPFYNEEAQIQESLRRIFAVNFPYPVEFILIDDGSTDLTLYKVKSMQLMGDVQIHSLPHKGKGHAVRHGYQLATGNYAIVQDGDLEYNPQDIIKLTTLALNEDLDVVYGNRYHEKMRLKGMLIYYLGNRFLTGLVNFLMNAKLADMECCYKLIRTSVIQSLNLESDSFEIEPEITCKLLKKNYSIHHVAVDYKFRSHREGKKIKFIDGIKAIFAIFKYCILISPSGNLAPSSSSKSNY